MSEKVQIPLQQVFTETLSKMLKKIGLDRQLMVDLETYRLYVHDGKTPGGHPLRKMSDITEDLRGIRIKGPDPKKGETWVLGEWPSDDDPLVMIPAYVAGAVGGGGGSVELQQNGQQVVEAASVLNFGKGVFVDETGLVSTKQPAKLDWSVDISGPTPAITISNPTNNGLSWSGAAGAGFSSVPAVAFATAIQNMTYFEITMPAKAGDFSSMQLLKSKPSADNFILPLTGSNYLTITLQGGNLGSTPTVNDLGLNIPIEEEFLTFGIEIAESAGGIFFHRNGVRTQVHSGLEGPFSLVTMTAATATGTENTFTINPNPDLPDSIATGVVVLSEMENKEHPLSVFGDGPVLPGKVSPEERNKPLNNLSSAAHLFSPQDIAQMAIKHTRLNITSPVSGTSDTKYGVKHVILRSSDNSIKILGNYQPNEERELTLNLQANLPTPAPTGTAEQINTNSNTDIRQWSGNVLYTAIRKEIKALRSSFTVYVASDGSFSNSDLEGTTIRSINKQSSAAGVYEINWAFSGPNVHIQPDSNKLIDFTALQGKNGNRLYLKFFDRATGDPIDVAYSIQAA